MLCGKSVPLCGKQQLLENHIHQQGCGEQDVTNDFGRTGPTSTPCIPGDQCGYPEAAAHVQHH
eukprot:921983-Pyramimonas_sp.AAC.1